MTGVRDRCAVAVVAILALLMPPMQAVTRRGPIDPHAVDHVVVSFGTDVSIYGDSLTWRAQPAYAGVGAVHSYPGTTLVNWYDAVLDEGSSIVVLALGSNDAIGAGTGPWAELFDALPATTCVVWPIAYRSAARPAIVAFDGAMSLLASSHSNVHVVDWDSSVRAHPEWLSADGLHYNPAGDAAYAKMLATAPSVCR